MQNSLTMNYVPKGWGFEKWIVNCDEYCGKLLYFVKGKRCSWHYHKLKDEVFYIQSGRMLVKYSDEDNIDDAKEVILEKGDNFHVSQSRSGGCILISFLYSVAIAVKVLS